MIVPVLAWIGLASTRHVSSFDLSANPSFVQRAWNDSHARLLLTLNSDLDPRLVLIFFIELRMTRTNRDVWTSFLSSVQTQCGVHCVRCCAVDVRHIVAQGPSLVHEQHVTMHAQHGTGAVILSAPRNAGGKPVKRKRGGRSEAAIAARIDREYLSSSGTAGSTACNQSNHVDARGTTTDGSGHPAVECAAAAARDGGDDTHVRKRKPRTAGAKLDRDVDQHARSARAGWSGTHKGDRQARTVRRRPDEVRGLVVQAEIVPRSRGSAVSDGVEDDRSIVNTETRREAQLRGELSQHTDVQHARDDNDRISIGQVSQCRHERRVRGQETVRDGVGNGVCWTLDERATDNVGSV